VSGLPHGIRELGHAGPCGIPWDAWELLDPALQEALLEGGLAPEELPELAGWVDEDDRR
jgi:hypothetical protein